MEQTPIEQLIKDTQEEMNGCYTNLQEHGLSPLERRHYNAAILVCKDVIKRATELLAVEKERDKQIAAKAFKAGIEIALFEKGRCEGIKPPYPPNKEEYISSLK